MFVNISTSQLQGLLRGGLIQLYGGHLLDYFAPTELFGRCKGRLTSFMATRP